MEKVPQEPLGCSLVIASKEVKTGLYGEDGHVFAELEAVYLSLNPAQLKRDIESKLDKLYQTYEQKRRTHELCPHRKLVPHTTTFLMMQQPKLGYLLK